MTMVQRAAWGGLDGLNAAEAAGFVQRVEGLGYGALWIPDALGREPLSHASWLLANTTRLVIATGIVLFWNLFANRFWTFSDVDRAAAVHPSRESKSHFAQEDGIPS